MGRPPSNKVIRKPEELPQIGDWYISRFDLLAGYDLNTEKKFSMLRVGYSQVLFSKKHGNEYIIEFDPDSYKEELVDFRTDYYTKSEVLVKMLRMLADKVERGSKK